MAAYTTNRAVDLSALPFEAVSRRNEAAGTWTVEAAVSAAALKTAVDAAPNDPGPARQANADAIRAGLQTAIQNNINATAQITAVATKANGYANNPAADLTTVQITSVLKDICSGIVLTSQAILECERQLTGIERLMLGQVDTTAGS